MVAAPAAPPSPAQGTAMAPAQPGPVQGNEQLPPGHPSLDGAAPEGAMPEGAAPGQDGGMAMQNAPPHGAAMSAGGDEVVVKVPKATGTDARTVAEIFAQRQALKDQTVTVRGKVVRFNAGCHGQELDPPARRHRDAGEGQRRHRDHPGRRPPRATWS